MLFIIGVIIMLLSLMALKKSPKNGFFAITWSLGLLIIIISIFVMFGN